MDCTIFDFFFFIYNLDKTRPVLICPTDITETTLPGKNYTYVYWSLPNAIDNSGLDCNVWSKPHVTFPWKVQIGKHTIKYIAQDISGNRARCTFFVNVIGESKLMVVQKYIITPMHFVKVF